MDREAMNPYLAELDRDVLYHLGLTTDMDLPTMFGDTKFVCMGGSPARAERFARKAAKELHVTFDADGLRPIGKTDRFHVYKVGPVVSASHGMGMGSLSIFLNEVTKLLHYAKCGDVTYVRIGTSGGIGIEPGSVVVALQALNAEMQPLFDQYELGERHSYPTSLDPDLARQLALTQRKFNVVLGKTMGIDSFYEGQNRLDGALPPSFTKKERDIYWQLVQERGVKNMEMEATRFAAFCIRAKIRAALVCSTLINRLEGDQVSASPEQLEEWCDHAQEVVMDYIKQSLKTEQ